MKGQGLKWKAAASYTVEVAFVVPIVIGLAFVIFYVLFLLHDKVMLQANLDNLIFSLVEEKEISKEEYEDCLQTGIWLLDLKDVAVKDKRNYVKGVAQGTIAIKIPVFGALFGEGQTIKVVEKYYKIQPEEMLRYGPEFIRN